MPRRCVYQTLPNFIPQAGLFQVKVYHDTTWDELVCRLYVNGKLLPSADYHSAYYAKADYAPDDLADAIETAHHMARFTSTLSRLTKTSSSGTLGR